MTEKEYRHGDNIFCPYCNYEQSDMWEVSEDARLEECPECNKKFRWRRETEVEYVSTCNCEDNNEEHDYDFSGGWTKHSKNNYLFKIGHCKKCSEYEVKRKQQEAKKE